MSDSIPGSNGIINSGYILPSSPFVNPKTGIITTVWWRFLITLLARTGGPSGIPITDVELIAVLGGVQPDEPVDLATLADVLRSSDADVAQDMLIDVALAMAAMAAPEMPDADVLPAMPEDAVTDDLASLLVAPSSDPLGLADGWTWGVGAAAVVVPDTYTLMGYAPFAGSITSMAAVVGPAAIGALTETVTINGVAVTGIDTVAVNSATAQTFAATAACNFVRGDMIAITVAIASGVPVGAWSTVQYTRMPQ